MAKQTDLTSLQPLDGALRVLCTFDYTPAESKTLTSPGSAGRVCVTGVAINGHEVDAGVFHPKVIEAWEADILVEMEADAEIERECADLLAEPA